MHILFVGVIKIFVDNRCNGMTVLIQFTALTYTDFGLIDSQCILQPTENLQIIYSLLQINKYQTLPRDVQDIAHV